MKVKSESDVAQLSPTLSDPMDPSGSAIHGIFQARVLEWVAIAKANTFKKKKDEGKIHGRHVGGRPRKVNKKQNITQGHGAQRILFPAAYGGS